MIQIGRVEQTDGEVAVVSVRRASACGENCAMCKGGCAPTQHRATVKNPVGAACGDLVKIETEDGAVLRSAALVYLVPLLLMFLCYGVCYAWLPNAALAAIAAAVGLAGGFFLLRAVDRKSAPVPRITQVLGKEREER